MEDNPTGCMGLPDYLGRKSKGEIPIVCVPGCPVQADNFMETLALADWGLNELISFSSKTSATRLPVFV
jgi:Ni,Fe-hydrogenase I small subunit